MSEGKPRFVVAAPAAVAAQQSAHEKAQEIVAVVQHMCTRQPDPQKTPLLLDRLSYNCEVCLADGLRTSFSAMVLGRSPLYALVRESHSVMPPEQRGTVQRMEELATRMGTSAVGRARIFLRLLFNNRLIATWVSALCAAPSYLEFASSLFLSSSTRHWQQMCLRKTILAGSTTSLAR